MCRWEGSSQGACSRPSQPDQPSCVPNAVQPACGAPTHRSAPRTPRGSGRGAALLAAGGPLPAHTHRFRASVTSISTARAMVRPAGGTGGGSPARRPASGRAGPPLPLSAIEGGCKVRMWPATGWEGAFLSEIGGACRCGTFRVYLGAVNQLPRNSSEQVVTGLASPVNLPPADVCPAPQAAQLCQLCHLCQPPRIPRAPRPLRAPWSPPSRSQRP